MSEAGREQAHGRVNLIGEHTDYNGGFVLPAAIPQSTITEYSRRPDGLVRLTSDSAGARPPTVEFRPRQEKRAGDWTDYVQGITWALTREGHHIGGLEARISSTVPISKGLSSSAALEISFFRAVRSAFGLPIDDLQMARLAQKAENEFAGAPVGILDQMACTFADVGTALFLDTRSLAFERVPLPPGVRIAVIDSGITHDIRSGEYRRRREECERAAAMLGVSQLRDLAIADLPRIDALPEPYSRRARHVVTEDQRVLDAVAAMLSNNVEELGRLFGASHASMRDDYQVSLPEIDLLVELAGRTDGVIGARLTGGGFGGAVVLLVRPGSEASLQQLAAEYSRRTNRPGRLLV